MSVVGMAVGQVPSASDADLVRATRAHDDGAFEELYRRYRGPIGHFVRSFVRDHGRAEDIVQEAFVAALRRMRQTECEIHFRPWIYEIARNAAIDHHRRTSRAQEVSFDSGGLPAADRLRLTSVTAPETSVIDKERFENLRVALDELSDTHHSILVMRELEGLSYREIGRRLQLSSAAVESALFRARRRLEDEYEQLDTGRRCAMIRTVIGRLAEGVESRGDRRRLDRHAARCTRCRRCALQLGVEPLPPRSLPRRAVALLPLPPFLRRFGTGLNGTRGSRDPAGVLAGPAVETFSQGAQKAAVVVASAIAIGGGGATLGGVGPLAVDPGPAKAERQDAIRKSGSSVTRQREGVSGGGRIERSDERRGTRPIRHRGSRTEPSSPSRRRAEQGPSAAAPAEPAPAGPSAPAAAPPAGEQPLERLSGGGAPAGQTPELPALPEPSRPPDAPALPTDLSAASGQADVGSVLPDASGTAGQVGIVLQPPG